MHEIVCADVLKWCADYDGPKFHALLCDPPYSLGNGKQGFMGKVWDNNIAFHPETWAALAEHLLPGAFGTAFASARGYHRVMVAIEDAGLRLHPSIFGYTLLGWNYGSGFPKATRIDTQIELRGKTQRIRVDGKPCGHDGGTLNGGVDVSQVYSEPTTDLAKAWAGHRYGLQALKPALEPIIVFQVPYKGKPVESIVETGAGALNIDGGRIAHDEECKVMAAQTDKDVMSGHGKVQQGGRHKETLELKPSGRWPANFYLGDEEAARRLGEQSGESKSIGKREHKHSYPGVAEGYQRKNSSMYTHKMDWNGPSDTGTAARFFFNVNTALDEADPVLYCAKASRKERDAGLEGMPRTPTDWQRESANLSDPRMDHRQHREAPRNHHPTIKPLDLTRWLATLLLPPEEYAPRRILVPFAGSGSEMIGAHLAGWEEIVGIEMEREYCGIAEARMKHWCKQVKQLKLV